MKEEILLKMSQGTGIPVFKIKKALGIELHNRSHTTNLEEALIEFRQSAVNSEEQEVALIKVNKYLLNDIKRAITMRQIKECYNMCPSGSEAEKAAIVKIATFYHR